MGALIGAIALATVLGACSSGRSGDAAGPTSTLPAPAKVAPPTPIPVPAGKPVLTLTGMLSNRNQGATLLLDQHALDSMATETSTVFEPFDKKNIRFTGIPMSVLLTRAGISPKATKVQVHALDDYKVGYTVADLMAPGVLLATKADGADIPIAKGGPIRLVFPPTSAVGKNRDTWIWSIDSIAIS